MSASDALAQLKARLAKAQSDCNVWRAAGHEENYLEASCRVEALEIQLGKLEPPPARTPRKELNITYNGRKYEYRGYQYDRFLDAVNYARLDLSRPRNEGEPPRVAALTAAQQPGDADEAMMRSLGITYREGAYYWREYRYDRLAEAIAYARLDLSR